MPVKPSLVGERIKRREDPRLIRGLATYTDDIKLHGMLHAAVVRSDYAAGEIEGIDTSRARALEGVVAVYTYDDLRGRVGRTPCAARPEDDRDVEHPLLADGRVRFVGQPIALVIAEDRYVAQDAVLRVEVSIAPGEAVVDMKAALAADAPRVYEQFPDNVCARYHEPSEDIDRWFDEADGTLELELVNQRVAPVPMEGRAVLASWDEGAQKLTVWSSTQIPHQLKQQLSICLGIPELRIRVIAPEVGGGFGCKLPVYPEECLLPWASRELRRPIKWAETRTESLMNTTHGRGHVHKIEAAYKNDGELLALRGQVLSDIGAFPSFFGASIATFTPLLMSGCYNLRAIDVEVICVYTNTMATDAYRGAGRPEAAFTLEQVMDEIAAKLGLDAVDVRRRNFIAKDAFPFHTASGATYDSGDYEAALDRAIEIFDYTAARAAQERARAEGKLVGLGVASFTEICGLGPSTDASPLQRVGTWESGMVRVEPTGSVMIATGVSPHGQGQETVFAQMAADAFGIDIDRVTVVHGDTDVVPHGSGTFGSRGLVVGGTAVYMALEKVSAKAKRIAAYLLDATESQVEFDGESFTVKGGERRMAFAEVAEAAHLWNVPVPGEEPGLEAVARFEPSNTTFPFGTHICQVEVDPETGEIELQRYCAVDDCGNVLNPLLVDGQRLGGIVQGLGQALCEEVVYDESGQLLTATLMDYAMPRAAMFPRIELAATCTPTDLNPLGAKGIGELGTIGSTPCLYSAVLDALRPLGVTGLRMPLKPERVWRAIQEAR
ncbi:MAG: xanthine dehydrogenase family protein molybdopterin-binding subunit [Myxococcota bacterium]